VAEAKQQKVAGTIAVVDRVGNVLAVYRMAGAATSVTVSSGRGVAGGLEGITVIPDTLAAIAKAVTGAYLSSEGNAFSTRTASQIVQEHFNPGTDNAPAGPLFGVQFSQLPCSDFSTRLGDGVGPQRSPLGLSADPGGFPLYKNGTPVGGVGVIADGVYGLDLNVEDIDHSVDEIVALAASSGHFAVPPDRSADHISAGGLTLRYSDATAADLRSTPAKADYATLTGSDGTLVAVPGYSSGAIVAGSAFGQPDSGIRPATDPDFAKLDGFVFVDHNDNERFAPASASDGALLGADALTASEVHVILKNALAIADRARAQIRQPLNSQARVTISVVDTYGTVLGIVRTRDAPVFGSDVSLQKARTAAFFSNSAAAGDLLGDADAIYLNADGSLGAHSSIGHYVTAVRGFLGAPTALADGAYAFGDRAGGNMSRPFYPDGQNGQPNGPFSKPYPQWSPFSDGLQLDLSYNSIIAHVLYELGASATDVTRYCPQFGDHPNGTIPRLANGPQIFPGSVPIYRGNTLVGGIGVSGDGVDQDDMISFLGLYYAGLELNTGIHNAPPAMRSDNLSPGGANLRFVECPMAPFLDSDEQHPCDGK
jgi:uncharacterized protein GlcG (DUF336 family)